MGIWQPDCLPASDAIAPTTDEAARGDGAMNIDASTRPASDAVTVKSEMDADDDYLYDVPGSEVGSDHREMDADDDYLYDVPGSEVGSDHHLNELINDLQADYIGDDDWLPTGPSSESGSDDPGADDSLPTGPTYGNLATRLPAC